MNQINLQNRKAIVTGGAKGIGRAIVERLLASGASVAIWDLDEDAVMETVGEATWAHSLRSLRPGGTIVVSGATSGPNPPADLNRVFFLQLNVVGSTMGTIGEFRELLDLMVRTGLRPVVDRVLPMEQAAEAVAVLAGGDVRGKLVLTR